MDEKNNDVGLMEIFDSICCHYGDEVAFIYSEDTMTPPPDIENNETCSVANEKVKAHRNEHKTLGFSEIQFAVKSLASELHHRHDISSKDIVWIVTSERTSPCPGEACALFACTKLRIPFVPVSISDFSKYIHTTDENNDSHGSTTMIMSEEESSAQSRLRYMYEDTKPVAAIILQNFDGFIDSDTYNDDDDFFMNPAFHDDHLATRVNELEERSHLVQSMRNLGIHRIIQVNSFDGMPLSPLTGLVDLPLPDCKNVSADHREEDVLYILYTSGSSSDKPKAVVQTHHGLIQRLQWQWKIFPFLQQLVRANGYKHVRNMLLAYRSDDDDHQPLMMDTVVRRTPLPFVDSMAEIYGTLLAGVPLWCPPSHLLVNGGIPSILEMAQEVQATRITLLPSQLLQALRHVSSCSKAWLWKVLYLVIVSGEPCSPCLTALFKEVFNNIDGPPALLVNLYGQTETAGDVLCSVVAVSCKAKMYDKDDSDNDDSTSSLNRLSERFPNATNYLSKKAVDRCQSNLPEDRYAQWMVPCGKPINNHEFYVAPLSRRRTIPLSSSTAQPDHQSISTQLGSKIGRLYVSGPGVALKYLNNKQETGNKFIPRQALLGRYSDDHSSMLLMKSSDMAPTRNDSTTDSSINSKCLNNDMVFDTGDLAFYHEGTQQFYIVGRAPTTIEEEEEHSLNGHQDQLTFSSIQMGKINGVMVHSSEIESAFSKAFVKVLHTMVGINDYDENSLNVVGTLFSSVDNNNDHLKEVAYLIKSAVFIDLTCLTDHFENKGKESIRRKQTFIDPNLIQPLKESPSTIYSMEDILLETRRLLLGSSSLDKKRSHKCHMSELIPNHIFLVKKMPTNGIAQKVDRRALNKLAIQLLAESREDYTVNAPEYVDGKQLQDVIKEEGNMPLDNLVSAISKVYSETLSLDSFIVEKKVSLTFAELGGNSLMSIEAAHRINNLSVHTQDKNVSNLDEGKEPTFKVDAGDLLRYPLLSICKMVLYQKRDIASFQASSVDENTTGRDKSNYEKKQRINDDITTGDDSILLHLDNKHDSFPTSTQKYNNDNDLIVAWRLRMLMCVDAPPLLMETDKFGEIVLVGSQGGDILISNVQKGSVLTRLKLNGCKIEGGINHIRIRIADENGKVRTEDLVMVPSYRYDPTDMKRIGKGREGNSKGCLHAFRLDVTGITDSEVLNLTPIWNQELAGELKSMPACLETLDNNQNEKYMVLIGSYDGVVSLLDSASGEIIATLDEVGGAIHANPTIIPSPNESRYEAFALIASSTWTGRASLLKINHESMQQVWNVDLSAPIYGSPCSDSFPSSFLITDNSRKNAELNGSFAFVGAVDGIVRSINLTNGKEVWTYSTKKKKPIFSQCKPFHIDGVSFVVFGSHEGSVTCLESKSGGLCWIYETNATIIGSPVIVENNFIVVATLSGQIISLDPSTGKEKKRYRGRLNAEIFSSPMLSSSNDSILFGCRDDFLYRVWV